MEKNLVTLVNGEGSWSINSRILIAGVSKLDGTYSMTEPFPGAIPGEVINNLSIDGEGRLYLHHKTPSGSRIMTFGPLKRDEETEDLLREINKIYQKNNLNLDLETAERV